MPAHEDDTYDSSISSGCLLYPVYVTVELKTVEFLDKIILDSRRGIAVYDDNSHSSALVFMNSLATGVYVKSGSHVPMQPFPEGYPWAGISPSEIYHHFRDAYQGSDNGISDHGFAVLDEETVKNGTLLLCSDTAIASGAKSDEEEEEKEEEKEEEEIVTVRADAYMSLVALVSNEAGTKPLKEYQAEKRKAGSKGFVLTEERDKREMEEYKASVQAKKDRGEPLREIEKKITGLE